MSLSGWTLNRTAALLLHFWQSGCSRSICYPHIGRQWIRTEWNIKDYNFKVFWEVNVVTTNTYLTYLLCKMFVNFGPVFRGISIYYLYSVGVAGVWGTGSRVVHSISWVAARLVGGQPEQRPVALLKPKWVLLGASKVILTFKSQAPQRLGVQASQFRVNSLPTVYVTQKGLELHAGAQIWCETWFWGREGHTELRGRGAGDAAPAVDAQTPVSFQWFVQCPGPWGSA